MRERWILGHLLLKDCDFALHCVDVENFSSLTALIAVSSKIVNTIRFTRDVRAVSIDFDSIALTDSFVRSSGRADLAYVTVDSLPMINSQFGGVFQHSWKRLGRNDVWNCVDMLLHTYSSLCASEKMKKKNR